MTWAALSFWGFTAWVALACIAIFPVLALFKVAAEYDRQMDCC